MSVLARAPVLRFQSQIIRSLHKTAPARSAGGHYHHLPFNLPGKKQKGVFGFKLFVYLASGFSIPFAAAAYQLKKAGA